MGYVLEALDNYGVALDVYAAIGNANIDEVADAVVLRSSLLL
jgi:hypothetical protein